jgi:glycosyltransferase involved in cell wall biosynthesis
MWTNMDRRLMTLFIGRGLKEFKNQVKRETKLKKKHILFIVENSSPPYDTRVWNEALAAKEFGYDVTVLSPVDYVCNLRYENLNGIKIYRHPNVIEAKGVFGLICEYSNALFWEILYSALLYIIKPFDVIHAANPPDHIFLIGLIFKLFRKKFVFDHHDLTPEAYFEKFNKRDLLYRISLFLEHLSLKTANVVISTNESYKKIALKRGVRNPRSVFVVRNGPNISKIIFKEPNTELKKGFDFLVGYVGVMNRQDGIDNLLSAAEYLVYNKEVRNIRFILIGTGAEFDRLVQLSKRLGLEDYVKFTGFVPNEILYEIISTCDICVNPEFRNDFTDKSTMIKIMQYMVFGKPIVQFYTTEGEITAGESAAYIKNNDIILFAEKILALLHNREERERMGKIGKERILDRLNWDIQKNELKKAYEYLEMEDKKAPF